MIKRALAAIALTAMLSATAFAQSPGPDGAKVYFITPVNGAEVSSPLVVQFGLSGMGVAPAGVENEKTGHHHLIINTKLENYAEPIPADDNHKHFGGGQTEATIELPPGEHRLQLIVGDHNHIPHAPPIESEVIVITVK